MSNLILGIFILIHVCMCVHMFTHFQRNVKVYKISKSRLLIFQTSLFVCMRVALFKGNKLRRPRITDNLQNFQQQQHCQQQISAVSTNSTVILRRKYISVRRDVHEHIYTGLFIWRF